MSTLYVSAMMYTTDEGHDIYAPAIVFRDSGGATVAHTVLDYNPANFYPAGFCLGYTLAEVPAGAATFKASFGGSFDAETQFFVSKVRMGAYDGDAVNLCPNPDFDDLSDWTFPDAPGGLSYEATRDTSPPVALPAGESACARMRWRLSGGANPMQSVAIESPAPTPDPGLSANLLINGGATFVFDRDVLLTLNPGSGGAEEMAVKNDGDEWSAWQAYAPTLPWTLAAGPLGARKVWARFR